MLKKKLILNGIQLENINYKYPEKDSYILKNLNYYFKFNKSMELKEIVELESLHLLIS